MRCVIRDPRNSFVIGSHGLTIVKSHHPADSVYGSWLPIARMWLSRPRLFLIRKSYGALIKAVICVLKHQRGHRRAKQDNRWAIKRPYLFADARLS